jgi:hypothetical protein
MNITHYEHTPSENQILLFIWFSDIIVLLLLGGTSMDDWINGACDQVDAIVSQDDDYRKLSNRRRALEQQCMDILDTLTPVQRNALEEYEYVIMEMAYQRTRTAYQLGKRRSRSIQPTERITRK